ncbi:MAG: hypothetical protein M0R22_04390 [Dehalococcoidia bacterium]|jgi:hypothetical protein|nr:hypothetical protein [Dehalococcoidia bacterium]
MSGGQDDIDFGVPTCPSCGVPWRDHLGPAGMCAEVRRLKKIAEEALQTKIDQRIAVQKLLAGFAFTWQHEDELRLEGAAAIQRILEGGEDAS